MSETRKIDSIRVGKRHRKDMGDLQELANSIDAVGLLHPIVITPDDKLIAGERRLRALRILKRQQVPVFVVDLKKIVRGELAENTVRKDFHWTEWADIGEAVEELERVEAKARMVAAHASPGKFPELAKGNTRDKVAKVAGISGRTYVKAKAVAKAIKDRPKKFAKLAEEKTLNSAFRKMRQAEDESRVQALEPVAGKFKTLVIDPPWDYEWLSIAGRAAPGYATMTHEQLLALDVAAWAEDNCHLYLWTTNNFMTRAVELMARWGFQHKTVLTWVKPRWGLGSYFRNSTEHVLFGVRGELRTRSDSIATHFEAPVGEHSEKPEKFYEIVRAASYGPMFGEIFQRTARPDFLNLYQPAEAVAA